MDENHEVATKQNFLANMDLGYKQEYEFENGVECFDFMNREFGIEQLQVVEKSYEIVNICKLSNSTHFGKHEEQTRFTSGHVFYENKTQRAFKFALHTDNKKQKEVKCDYLKSGLNKIIKNVQGNNFNIEVVFENSDDTEIKSSNTIGMKNNYTDVNENSNNNRYEDNRSENVIGVIGNYEDSQIFNSKPQLNGKYQCKICRKCFDNNMERTHHVNLHLEKHDCPFCAAIFTDKNDLLKHCTLHLIKETSKFLDIRKDCPNNENIDTTKNNLRCTKCFMDFSKKYSLKRHLRNKHACNNNNISKQVSCNRKTFSDLQEKYEIVPVRSLSKICKIVKPKKIICAMCSQAFCSKFNLKKHLQNVHKQKGIFNKYTNSLHLKKYDLTKKNDHFTSKDIVDNTFEAPELQEKDENIKIDLKNLIRSIDKKPNKHFKCIICLKTFSNKENLKNHLFSYIQKDIKVNIKKGFQCYLCYKIFVKSSVAQIHIKRCRSIRKLLSKNNFENLPLLQLQNKPIKMKALNNTKTFKTKLKSHGNEFVENNTDKKLQIKNYDELIKRKICPICSKKFNSVFYVKKHIKIFHNIQKEFKCKVCQKIFSSEYQYNRHSIVHNLKCEVCQKKFTRSFNLRRHFTIHTDIRKS